MSKFNFILPLHHHHCSFTPLMVEPWKWEGRTTLRVMGGQSIDNVKYIPYAISQHHSLHQILYPNQDTPPGTILLSSS